jgi:head-tail adaptor
MSLGKMKTSIEIVQSTYVKDIEGFVKQVDQIIATIKAYREGRHGSEKWANRATFSEATELFRFRSIPGIKITTEMTILCDQERYEIISAENVRGRGMYWEVLAKKVVPSSG